MAPRVAKAAHGSRRGIDQSVIVDVAARLFAERGFRNTRMQDLADEVGIAKPTLYVYGRSKTDILGAIFEHVIKGTEEQFQAARARSERPDEQLQAIVEYWMSSAGHSLRPHYTVISRYESELPRRLGNIYRRRETALLDNLRQILVDGQRQGIFEPSCNVTAAAIILLGATHWAVRWYTEGGPLTAEQVANTISDIFLKGVQVRP